MVDSHFGWAFQQSMGTRQYSSVLKAKLPVLRVLGGVREGSEEALPCTWVQVERRPCGWLPPFETSRLSPSQEPAVLSVVWGCVARLAGVVLQSSQGGSRAMKRWVLVVSLSLVFASIVSAQGTPTPTPQTSTTGIAVSKSCPPSAAPGALFTCTFSVQNLDPAFSVTGLSVTNTVPFPGGTTTAVPCLQGPGAGTPVTTLGPFGTATDTCTGSVDETAPPCSGTQSFFSDQIE